MSFFEEDKISALEAKEAAQWISFGPVVFQSARVLRNSGVLHAIEASGLDGITLEEITERVNLPLYGVRVLLESALSIRLIIVKDRLYRLAKTGMFILNDELTITNMDFVHDVCYKGMYSLDKSIASGRPEGLKEFGTWSTIYEGLSELPDNIQRSWFSFDHFFSDNAFPMVLPRVLKDSPKKLLDIGGNTGKWAIACAQKDVEISVTIMDLPGQLQIAAKSISDYGLSERISLVPANILDEGQAFPAGFDVIWMSQFLDCFSEKQIISILKRSNQSLKEGGCLFILEPFWDRQRFEVAAFCLQQTSLYFTALANGNSQMYGSDVFIRCIEEAGFVILEQKDNIGLSQTLLKCVKKPAMPVQS